MLELSDYMLYQISFRAVKQAILSLIISSPCTMGLSFGSSDDKPTRSKFNTTFVAKSCSESRRGPQEDLNRESERQGQPHVVQLQANLVLIRDLPSK